MNLNQITVSVSNIENAIIFYKQLGLLLIVKSAHYARFECPEGGSTFSLHLAIPPFQNDETRIYFEIENLDEKVKELLSKKIMFDELPTDKPWLWREAQLKDPDGNRLILYYAGLNRKNPPWRIENT